MKVALVILIVGLSLLNATLAAIHIFWYRSITGCLKLNLASLVSNLACLVLLAQ